MAKRKKRKLVKNKKSERDAKLKKPSRFALPEETKRLIWAVAMFLAAVIVLLSFFDLAGTGGSYFIKTFKLLFGRAIFVLPLIFTLAGLAFWRLEYKSKWPIVLAGVLLMLGISAISESFNQAIRQGGWVGYLITFPLLKAFGLLATQIVFLAVMATGSFIFWQFIRQPQAKKPSSAKEEEEEEEQPTLIKKIFLLFLYRTLG